jgi:hypothetical protein
VSVSSNGFVILAERAEPPSSGMRSQCGNRSPRFHLHALRE